MNYSRDIVSIQISHEMLAEAERLAPTVKVERTQASPDDSVVGVLGEFVWAQYRYGDWRKNSVGKNKGKIDDVEVEVKASQYPLNPTVNLLVREDYKERRHPDFYVQIMIDMDFSHGHVCGFATGDEVDVAPKKDFGKKSGGPGGYLCYYIPITNLHPINELLTKLAR